MLTTIPFSGFYGTIHEDNLDRELEQMIEDDRGNVTSQRIADEIWGHVRMPFTQYAKEFAEGFETMFNGDTGLDTIKLTFESMQSPREYNFQTDRIFAEVSFSDVQKMFQAVDRKIFDLVVRENFTSRSGFISYYNNDWRTWGSLKKWDHNQIGTLIAALVRQFLDRRWESNIVEDWSGNGHIGNWVYDGLDDEGKRLIKISDYLRKRQERKFRQRRAS